LKRSEASGQTPAEIRPHNLSIGYELEIMGDPGETVYRIALKRALMILARRDHSVGELIQKLTLRGYAEDIVQRVVAECRRLNYLDDERAALQVIHGMKRKGMGTRRIRSELRKRGLDGEQADGQLRTSVTPADEWSMAQRVALKKWKSLGSVLSDQEKKIRLQRFLQYRGFSDSVILRMLKEMPL
jgi:regulatory protein